MLVFFNYTQNNENNYEGAEKEERKKNKIISNSKKEFGEGSFINDVRKKV